MATMVMDESRSGGAATPWRRGWRAWAAPLAGTWSLAYGTLGLGWALGMPGFPYGAGAGETGWMPLLDDLRAEAGGPMIAALCLIGAAVALAMARGSGRGAARGLLIGFGWAMCVVLLLVVPDARLLAVVGYLPALVFAFRFDAVDWPIANQALCMAGGFAWGGAAVAYQQRTGAARDRVAVGATAARWTQLGRWATALAVALPLPYAVSRLAWTLGIPLGIDGGFLAGFLADDSARIATASLSGMTIAGALLTLGLAQPWGEAFPRWAPVLAGKRVPPALAVVPAAAAAVVLTVGGLTLWRVILAEGLGDPADAGGMLPTLLFLPWGLALALATLAYQRRRQLLG